MARDAVSVTAATLATLFAAPAGTTITVANGAYVAAGSDCSRLLLILTNTAVADKIFTIKAGDSPSAIRSGLGDLAVTVPASSTRYLFVESQRHVMEADVANSYPAGRIDIDFGATTTGSVAAVRFAKDIIA
jgi:hypothetical protein